MFVEGEWIHMAERPAGEEKKLCSIFFHMKLTLSSVVSTTDFACEVNIVCLVSVWKWYCEQKPWKLPRLETNVILLARSSWCRMWEACRWMVSDLIGWPITVHSTVTFCPRCWMNSLISSLIFGAQHSRSFEFYLFAHHDVRCTKFRRVGKNICCNRQNMNTTPSVVTAWLGDSDVEGFVVPQDFSGVKFCADSTKGPWMRL